LRERLRVRQVGLCDEVAGSGATWWLRHIQVVANRVRGIIEVDGLGET